MTSIDRLCGSALSGAIGAAFLSSAARADPGDPGFYDHYGMMGGGAWLYGPVMMVLFFVLLVGAVVLVVRLLGTEAPRPDAKQEDRAHAILRERFARGAITKEEFDASRRVLDGEA